MYKSMGVKMNRRFRNTSKLKSCIITHVDNNVRNYLIVSIIFTIGIIVGIIFINKTSEVQFNEIKTHITSSINYLKENKNVDTFLFLIESLKKNILIAIFLWIMGSTVVGIPVVYLTVGFRGFCLGYTISSIILSLGIGKGILFLLSTILLQNILFIPCILAMAVSGMKLHNSILEDKRKDNIKQEILMHTLFSLLIIIMLIIASLVEVYISKNILFLLIKYI